MVRERFYKVRSVIVTALLLTCYAESSFAFDGLRAFGSASASFWETADSKAVLVKQDNMSRAKQEQFIQLVERVKLWDFPKPAGFYNIVPIARFDEKEELPIEVRLAAKDDVLR